MIVSKGQKENFMTKNQALVIAIVLLIGIGIGYLISKPSNNLEPVSQNFQSTTGQIIGQENSFHSEGESFSMHGGTMNPQSTGGMAGMTEMGLEPISPETLIEAEKRVAASPKDPDLIVEVARIKRRLGRIEEAQKDLEKALSINKNNANAIFELAVIAMHEQGDESKAAEYFEKYVKLAPDGPKAEMAKKAAEALKNGVGM